jgi:hypothetical protein
MPKPLNPLTNLTTEERAAREELFRTLLYVTNNLKATNVADCYYDTEVPMQKFALGMEEYVLKAETASNLVLAGFSPSVTPLPRVKWRARRGDRLLSPQVMSLSRFLTYNAAPQADLHGRYDRCSIEEFCDSLAFRVAAFAPANVLGPLPTVKLFTGNDLITQYKNGVATESCMTGATRSACLAMYQNNPDHVALAVSYGEKNKAMARALLWTLDSGQKLLDCAYASDDDRTIPLLRWALSNGYYIRGSGQDDIISVEGIIKSVTVTLKANGISMYPYMDTLAYGYHDDPTDTIKLTNHNAFIKPNFKMTFMHCTGTADRQAKCVLCNRELGYTQPRTGVEAVLPKNILCEDCIRKHRHECPICLDTHAKKPIDGKHPCTGTKIPCTDCGEVFVVKDARKHAIQATAIHYRHVCKDCRKNYDNCSNCRRPCHVTKTKSLEVLQGRESRNYKVTTVGLCPVCYPTLLKTCPVCKAEYSMYSNSCPACYKTSLVKKAKPKCPKPKRP